MKKYWDEYHRLHPKKEKKLRYQAPKTWVKLSREEVNRRVSEGLKRKWEDPEFRARMQVLASEAGKKSKGHRAYNKGVPMSEETRRKVSESKKGQHWNLSEKTKAKMRKPKSEETRRKMSEAKKKMFADMTPEQRVAYAIRKKQEYNNSVRKAI